MTPATIRKAVKRNPDGVRRLARYLGDTSAAPVWQLAERVIRCLALRVRA
jgi:hypothetical protein